MRCLISGILFLLAISGEAMAACPSPNPNISAGVPGNPFVDGCPLPASGLNNLMNSISTKVTGSGSSSINEIVSFNNTTGTLLRQGAAQVTDSRAAPITADGAAITGYSQGGITAQAIFNQSVMSGNTTTFNNYDSLRGVTLAPALSTVNQINGIAGYTINNTVPIGQRSQTVAVFGDAVCAVNSSDCWGVDTIVSDNPTQTNTGVTSGTGKFLYNEFDLNITSPNTNGSNLQVGGTALPAAPTPGAGVNAIAINKLWGTGGSGTGTYLYGNGFIAADACCSYGLTLGASALSGSNIPSMPIVMSYRTSGGSYQNITMGAFGQMVFIGGSNGWGVQTADGGLANGLVLGMQSVSSFGANNPSQSIVLNYHDSANAARNYAITANTSGLMAFTGTAPSPQYFFVGALAASVNIAAPLFIAGSTSGVTCSGTPTSGFQSSGGIVTHC